LSDIILKHAEVVDIEKKSEQSFCSVEYFADKFEHFLKQEDNVHAVMMNNLQTEFNSYQSDKLLELDTSLPITECWCVIGQMKELGELKYKFLSDVMKSILCIPHSNAGCERIFSMVRKNHTDFRGSMATSTLESILVNKLDISSKGKPCFQQQFTEDFLKKAKSATYVSLHE
jgi:hypothetical protein